MGMKYRGVQNGTPTNSESLCNTCASAKTIKGYSETELITICDWGSEPLQVPFRVQECSGYVNKREPSLHQMYQIAWMLVSQGPAKTVGFVTAKEFQKIQNGTTS